MTDKKNLIYILIGTGKKPLASYSHFTGEFIETCVSYLSKAKPNTSSEINVDGYCIYYNNENNITYLLMTSESFPKETAMRCIESLKNEFNHILIGRNFDSIIEYGLSEELKEKLIMKFEYYNEHPEASNESNDNEYSKSDEDKSSKNLLIDSKPIEMEDKGTNKHVSNKSYQQGAIRIERVSYTKRILICIGIFLVILIIAYIIMAYIDDWDLKWLIKHIGSKL